MDGWMDRMGGWDGWMGWMDGRMDGSKAPPYDHFLLKKQKIRCYVMKDTCGLYGHSG